eukprot:scaffold87547_cov17-Tisochrysis_lutea.AAC.2
MKRLAASRFDWRPSFSSNLIGEHSTGQSQCLSGRLCIYDIMLSDQVERYEKERKDYASQKAACIKERFPDKQARKGLTKGPSSLN